MNKLETERLIIRKFIKDDIDSIYQLLSDETVNTYLPWFSLNDKSEANRFYDEYLTYNNNILGYNALCLKNNVPIGYVSISLNNSYEIGYALQKEY